MAGLLCGDACTKSEPRGANPTQDNSRTTAKAQMLHEALRRVEDELRRREEMNTATPSQATLSRHALELKLSSQTKQRPDLGRSASKGMQQKRGESRRRSEPPTGRSAACPKQVKWRRHARTLLSGEAMVLLRSLAAALHGHAPPRRWSSGSRCAGLQQDINFGDSVIELRGDNARVKSSL